MPLSTELVELLADTTEVLIETRSGEDVTSTVIWVGVSGDMVFVRSVRGESGRWYQRAIANDDVTLIIGEFRLELSAVSANDPASIEAASEGFRRSIPTADGWTRCSAPKSWEQLSDSNHPDQTDPNHAPH